MEVGDIVFLYCSNPLRQIKYMMQVVKTNIARAEAVNDLYLFGYKYQLKPVDLSARFELIAEVPDYYPALSYNKHHEFGIKSQFQSGIRVPDSVLPNILDSFDVVYDDISLTFTEGSAYEKSVKQYERNQAAKVACLAHYGHSCQICGLDFEKRYGEVGKDFIHVHHVDFISSFKGIEHEIEPVKGLIPVCPNCHAMLHHKVDGKYLTPEELKRKLNF